MTKIVGLLICWGMLFAAPCAVAQRQVPTLPQPKPQSLKPTFWKQRMLFIPYQVQPNHIKQSGKLLDPIAKVQLLSSRTGANDWAKLQEAEPNVQGFRFHAPEDGEYWFALRHLDRKGQPWPNAKVQSQPQSPQPQPLMWIVIDTAPPEITLEGSPDAAGEIVIRYEAEDANLQADSLMLEVRGVGDRWSPLRLGKPDIAQPNRLVGRVRWRPPAGAESIDVRAAIADRTGQRGKANAKIAVRDAQPALTGPSLSSPSTANASANPLLQVAQLPSQDWPASNRLPRPAKTAQAPPHSNPYTVAGRTRPSRTPAKLVGDGLPDLRLPSKVGSGPQTLRVTPLGPDNAPPLMERPARPTARSARERATAQSDWAPARSPADFAPADLAARVVNSRTFDIEYDLQSVGPWGVAKVEIWGTHDDGRTWQSFGVDPDNRSPIRVTVPAAGTFGFRILVDGANSAGSIPPQSGDEPELNVSVDLQPPTTELLAAELGQGNLADHLLVRWAATDTNLEPRPIALFYSSYPNGPWSTIASGLENTGKYTWRIERHVPGRFYLRLEARDTAGNLATYQTPSPIALARPQPTGRLRSVRSISEGSQP